MERKVPIRTEKLRCRLGGREILHGVELLGRKGEFIGLIGPNGCGKTTLLRTIARVYRPSGGAVYLDGRALADWDTRAIARRMAVLGQERGASFDFPVLEMVRMGRYAHHGPLRPMGEADDRCCMRALAQVGMQAFARRSFASLSGGEKQRVLLAAVLAQQTELILLDEPTNHLDIGYQLMLLERVRQLPDVTVLASLHDVNLAARYGDRLLAMLDGRIVADGPPEAVLTPALLRQLFQVEARVERDPDSGRPQAVFLRHCQAD